MNGAYQITVTSGSAFTYTSAGSAGTAITTAAAISVDLFNPPINYAAADRQSALYAIPASLAMSASGDGSGSTLQFAVAQDDTPTSGPWFTLVPDESRVRLVKADTGTTPASDKSNLFFVSTIRNITASMNGSGQGTLAYVDLADPTSALDRLVVYGQAKNSRFITVGGISRTSNVTTVTTQGQHGFVAGDDIVVSGVNGGGTATFNVRTQVASAPTTTTFTYSNPGADATGNTTLTPTSAAFKTKSTSKIVLTFANAPNLQTPATIVVSGLQHPTAATQSLVNGTFSGAEVNNVAKTITYELSRTVGTVGLTAASATVIGVATAAPPKEAQRIIARIQAGEPDANAVKRILGTIHQIKYDDYAMQRVIDTGTQTYIVGFPNEHNKVEVVIPPTTLRSALDTIVETFTGQDGKQRRYWVDYRGYINFAAADPTSAPTFATAPYKIITTGAGVPNTTTSAATIAPYNLVVTWDHNTTKNAVFVVPNADGVDVPLSRSYTDVQYTVRPNAPIFDAQVDYEVGASDRVVQIERTAKSFFLETHRPMLSIQFTLRGVGTAAHNSLGFNAGYAQTGASTFALVNSWQPGQWVDITCAELSLSGLYRVEVVDWGLEQGSFTQFITITANRRPTGSLTSIVQKRGKGKR